VRGGARWFGRTGQPPAGGRHFDQAEYFFQCYANYNYPSTRSTQMDSCSFAQGGCLIITSRSTFCHVCLFLWIHSIPASIKCSRKKFILNLAWFLSSVCISSFVVQVALKSTSVNVDFFPRRVKSSFLHSELTTFKVGAESDYRTSDSHIQSHRPIIPLPSRSNGNHTGKLWVWVTRGSGCRGRVGTQPNWQPTHLPVYSYP